MAKYIPEGFVKEFEEYISERYVNNDIKYIIGTKSKYTILFK